MKLKHAVTTNCSHRGRRLRSSSSICVARCVQEGSQVCAVWPRLMNDNEDDPKVGVVVVAGRWIAFGDQWFVENANVTYLAGFFFLVRANQNHCLFILNLCAIPNSRICKEFDRVFYLMIIESTSEQQVISSAKPWTSITDKQTPHCQNFHRLPFILNLHSCKLDNQSRTDRFSLRLTFHFHTSAFWWCCSTNQSFVKTPLKNPL